jgi:hypothetical protein
MEGEKSTAFRELSNLHDNDRRQLSEATEQSQLQEGSPHGPTGYGMGLELGQALQRHGMHRMHRMEEERQRLIKYFLQLHEILDNIEAATNKLAAKNGKAHDLAHCLTTGALARARQLREELGVTYTKEERKK